MHGLIPRHRRKAGSGPPAAALIAWISTDPHLRNAVARAKSHRREIDLPRPVTTRLANAAAAACFVLTSGAALGIAANMSDGLLTPPVPSGNNSSTVLSQGSTDTRASPTPPGIADQNPAISPTPTVVASTEQATPAPPVTKEIDHPAPDSPGQPGGYVRSSTPSPPAQPVPPRRPGKSGNSSKPIKPGKQDNVNMPADPVNLGNIDLPLEPVGEVGTSIDARQRGSASAPVNPLKLGSASAPANPLKPGSTGTPVYPGQPGGTGMLLNSGGSGDDSKPAGSRKPAEPGTGDSQPTSARRSTTNQRPAA